MQSLLIFLLQAIVCNVNLELKLFANNFSLLIYLCYWLDGLKLLMFRIKSVAIFLTSDKLFFQAAPTFQWSLIVITILKKVLIFWGYPELKDLVSFLILIGEYTLKENKL